MTAEELYRQLKTRFEETENGFSDLRTIIKSVLKFSETDYLLGKNCEIAAEQEEAILQMAEKRLSGIPVQYIIGEWDFYGNVFKVNENVLIPRPETEILCEYAIECLAGKKKPVVADLCAGSGCIGITVKDNIPDADVVLVEKSPMAAEVCRENIKNILGEDSAILKNGDIFYPEELMPLPVFDMIISNPPYIKSSEIAELQSEVQLEPRMALDGGEDGLIFYRLLAEKWTEYLADDGMFAFECGEDQAEDIKKMLVAENFDVYFVKDYNNIDRFVIGKRCRI
ncbi:MAG: peptide chain release factor N(5)-glutamine methyltransferase [Clostridia bacterium]|nr:peptide chain release factor N(5)-glutamine methyltransferase [Clostridia bacterium]